MAPPWNVSPTRQKSFWVKIGNNPCHFWALLMLKAALNTLRRTVKPGDSTWRWKLGPQAAHGSFDFAHFAPWKDFDVSSAMTLCGMNLRLTDQFYPTADEWQTNPQVALQRHQQGVASYQHVPTLFRQRRKHSFFLGRSQNQWTHFSGFPQPVDGSYLKQLCAFLHREVTLLPRYFSPFQCHHYRSFDDRSCTFPLTCTLCLCFPLYISLFLFVPDPSEFRQHVTFPHLHNCTPKLPPKFASCTPLLVMW